VDTSSHSSGETPLDESDPLYWIHKLKTSREEIFSHSSRVAALAEMLGSELHLSGDQLSDLRRGCFLHDIGKVMIPDRIVNSTAELTDQEQQELELHPLLGESIVLAMEGLKNTVAETVRSHHERWDGSGYPDQLKGTDIPLHARICSIANAFDHMLQERTVHKREALQEAKSKLKQGRDSVFDADLVSLFLTLPDEMLSIYSY
jgi:putative nucleotidyltransferase with HDIG domain